jgi:hypothetical protein
VVVLGIGLGVGLGRMNALTIPKGGAATISVSVELNVTPDIAL